MDSDDLYWVNIWRIIAAVGCVAIISLSSCTILRNHEIKEMVLDGVSPIQAACAYGIEGSTMTCVIQSANGGH